MLDQSNALSVLSVEDEPLVAQRIERLTRDILGDQISAFRSVQDLTSAFSVLEQEPFDVVLLDLNLGGEDGFELLARFASYASHTIVISAHTDRAVEAFEYGVLDFVAKPFSRERLAKAFERAKPTRSAAARALQFLTFRSGRRTEVVPVSDVVLLRGADKYTEVQLAGGAVHLHDKSLSRLEALLPDDFVRVHKSYIVPLSRIKQLQSSPGSKYDVLLHSGELIPVGRTRVADLRSLVGH